MVASVPSYFADHERLPRRGGFGGEAVVLVERLCSLLRLLDHAADDAGAAVASRVGHVVVLVGVDDERRAVGVE